MIGDTPRTVGWSRQLAWALLVFAAIGLLALRPSIGPLPGAAVQLFGAAIAAYALLVALTLQRVPWLSSRLATLLGDLVDADEKTWYAAIVLGHFAISQAASTVAAWFDGRSLADRIEAGLVERLIGFSVDTFLNALWASLWPVMVWDAHGGWSVLALGVGTYAMCALGGRIFGDATIPAAAGTGDD
jgi:hypothetical protein